MIVSINFAGRFADVAGEEHGQMQWSDSDHVSGSPLIPSALTEARLALRRSG